MLQSYTLFDVKEVTQKIMRVHVHVCTSLLKDYKIHRGRKLTR